LKRTNFVRLEWSNRVSLYGGILANLAKGRRNPANLVNRDNARDNLDNLDSEFSSTKVVTKGISRAYPLSSAIRTKAMG